MQKHYLKPRVLILHGWGGSDAPHWQDGLARELVSNGYPVYFPKLPNRDHPSLGSWIGALDKIIEEFQPSTVVCHSLGCILFLHYCQVKSEVSFEKVMLVAPPAMDTAIMETESFFPYPTPNFNANKKLLVTSTNDEYITAVDAVTVALQTGCETHIMSDAGHINSSAGFGRWDFAFDWVVA